MDRKLSTVNLKQVTLQDAYCVNALEKEKEKLNPIIQSLEMKKHLLDCKQELKELLNDPTRLTGKESFKKYYE